MGDGAPRDIRATAANGEHAASARDAVLVRRVCRGDMDAYSELVERHARRAYSIAYGVLRHRQDAEDAVQDAFARALEGIAGFDSGRPFRPWLYRIVVNTAISARRARDVRRTSELGEAAALAEPGPDRAVERAELRARLLRALDTLPDQQRTIVLLADMVERSRQRIHEVLTEEQIERWHATQSVRRRRASTPD